MEYNEILFSTGGLIIGYFLRQTHTDLKRIQSDFAIWKAKTESENGKLRGRVDLLEMDIKNELKSFKQINEIQYKSLRDEIAELKTLLNEIKKCTSK
jgi:uncharacterized membrane protein